jgi:hypothetical protein
MQLMVCLLGKCDLADDVTILSCGLTEQVTR